MTQLVAVTGATGFIGWHVADRFHQHGWRVRALVRPESGRAVPDGVERVTVRLHEADIAAAARGAELIVHLAAAIQAPSAAAFARSNVDGTTEVARAAQALGARLVHVSSLGVIGPRSPAHPPGEEDPPQPVNAYGESKRLAELAVRSVPGLEWTIVRPTLVYGPRDRLFHPVFRMARLGFFPVPNAKAVYNLIHVDDVARGIEAAALNAAARGETFFLGHPTHVAALDLLSELARTFGKPFRPLRVPRPILGMAAELGTAASKLGWRPPLDRSRLREILADGFVCRVDKARDRLGFVAAVPLQQGLSTTAQWYEKEGWL
jgi:nucleoside-diphosphate-sugar epimerase